MASPPPASIPDELLEEIFLRLPTPDALARAAVSCSSFRRVIKGHAFRRRFCVLHRPPLLGFVDAAGFHPAQATHPSSPLSVALGPCAIDFSFVPVPTVFSSYSYAPLWRPRDVRDGRVLLDWNIFMEDDTKDDTDELSDYGPRLARERCNAAYFHLAVCDPLSRRYVLLPTIPEDLATQPQDLLWAFEPVLAPARGDNGEEEPFKVICLARYQTKLVLFVFSSTTTQWCMVKSPIVRSFIRGCFYWTQPWVLGDQLTVLDTRTLRFSTVNILTGYHLQLRDIDPSFGMFPHPRRNAVVVGREGAIQMFSLVCQHWSFALHHTSLRDNSHEWKLEKIVQLPGQYHEYSISTVSAAEGFLFFHGGPYGEFENVDCYLMEVKTCEITKVYTKMENFFDRKHVLPYFSFPRMLSEPTI